MTAPSFWQKMEVTETKGSAVWKRVLPDTDESQNSFRIVDAVLDGGEVGPQTKRRKLTVIETSSNTNLVLEKSTTKSKKRALKVLDPLTRLVDDSLQQVHQGLKQISDHYCFIQTDPRLAHEFLKWVAWCHSSGGSLLHASAMWNDVEMVSDLMQLNPVLADSADGDDKTPYEVAQLSGHDSVCQVLEAFGGDSVNYVYDIFCLENEVNGEAEEACQEEPSTMTAVELIGGLGYWTDNGELILETNEKYQNSVDENIGEDDIDSNCEDYDGNDYPEEDDDDSWAEGFGPDQGYRKYTTSFNVDEEDLEVVEPYW
jgi:hypothetical protein